jgi:Glyoxalase-like domain
MATGVQVAFDCADPDRLARFWAAALGYQLQDPPPGFASWEDWAREQGVPEERWNEVSGGRSRWQGPRLYFQKVPEANTVVKNRVHLDLNVSGGRGTLLVEERRRIDAEVERLVGAGPTRLGTLEESGGYVVNMADPEGNEFDVQ